MDYKTAKRAIAAAWVVAGLTLLIDAVQEADMKTLLIPVEVTDTQYRALEKLAEKDAQDEATLIAAAAVTEAANRAITKIADEYMPRQDGFVGKETGDAEYLALVEEAESQTLQNEAEDAVIEMTAQVPAAHLTAEGGVFYGPSGRETWYNLDMSGVIEIMRNHGFNEDLYPYHVREDGCKMLGAYIMVAANLEIRPRGTILKTSLGMGIVCDTGSFAQHDPTGVDVAVTWGD